MCTYLIPFIQIEKITDNTNLRLFLWTECLCPFKVHKLKPSSSPQVMALGGELLGGRQN